MAPSGLCQSFIKGARLNYHIGDKECLAIVYAIESGTHTWMQSILRF